MFQKELPAGLPPKRAVDHAIETDLSGKPPLRPLYQLSPAELVAVKGYVVDLLRSGRIRRSKSPFGASLFFVKHKGSLRAVVDYRALNRITKRNNTPLPRADEMFDRLGKARVFSKLDLKTGFHQIRVRPEDIEKTAFNTKYGQFEYLVMPMGLCNAPATFQTLMNRIFYDCIDVFMVVYMDDLLIFSTNAEEHFSHLEIVLSRLQVEELYVSPKKCVLLTEETEFLGMIVGKEGIRVNPEKIEVVTSWPRPQSLTEVRSFIGLLQFFRRFIRDFSGVAAPLTALTKKGSGIHCWNSQCDRAFLMLKEALTTAPILMSPDWGKPFRCHVDASQKAVGGTLTQLDQNGSDRVIAYYSKKLSTAEEDYTANERELLALVYFLKRFRCYLEGSSFEVFTDNQVLLHFFSKPNMNRKEARWLDLLSQFGILRMNLKPGRVHVLGDVLSRAPHVMQELGPSVSNMQVSSLALDLQFEMEYETDQTFGPVVKGLRQELPSDSVQRDRVLRLLTLFGMDEVLLYLKEKVCVPRRRVRDLLHLAHDCKIAGHFAFAKTLRRLEAYHWKNRTRDVKKYVSGCLICQQQKDTVQKKKLTEPIPLDVFSRRWGSLATDFIVSLPKTTRGFDAIATWVDRLSRRVHFVPSHVTDTAVQVAESFFHNIFRHHGLLDNLVSDSDPKFTSKFWSHLMSMCGIRTQMSTSHHPQTDGSSEVMNRMVENYLRCYCSLRQDDWDTLLPAAEFAYNSSVSDDLGCSTFEVDLGWNPRSPLDMFAKDTPIESVNELKERLQSGLEDSRFCHQLAKARQSAYSAQKYRPASYKVGDKLWIHKTLFRDALSRRQTSDKLSAKRFGPFSVLELIGKNAVRLQLPSNLRIHPVVHVVHTAPFHSQPHDICQPVQPRPDPVPSSSGEMQYVVEKLVGHRKRGLGYQWLTMTKGAPRHEAAWQPTRDFVDADGTLTSAFHDYIIEHNLLPHLH